MGRWENIFDGLLSEESPSPLVRPSIKKKGGERPLPIKHFTTICQVFKAKKEGKEVFLSCLNITDSLWDYQTHFFALSKECGIWFSTRNPPPLPKKQASGHIQHSDLQLYTPIGTNHKSPLLVHGLRRKERNLPSRNHLHQSGRACHNGFNPPVLRFTCINNRTQWHSP